MSEEVTKALGNAPIKMQFVLTLSLPQTMPLQPRLASHTNGNNAFESDQETVEVY